MEKTARAVIFLALVLLLGAPELHAMDSGFGELQKLMYAPPRLLNERAEQILDEKYREGLQDLFNRKESGSVALFGGLPPYATANRTVRVAYRIAEKRPDLLARQHCFDEALSPPPKDLLACFLNQGKRGEYTDLAARSEICTGEAILTFLWSELGADSGEIAGLLRFMFDPALRDAPAITP